MPKEKKGIFYFFDIYWKGFCMGIADVIPGVSGGTIAFILGIYEEFILSIRSFDEHFLKRIVTFKWREAFAGVSWRFLGSLLAGIATAIMVFSHTLKWLLENQPVLINSFFFGLILATVPIIGHIIKKWNPGVFVNIFISTAITYFIVGLVPLQTPDALWFVFICGALAICAMVLPGISGAFILLLLGKYPYILQAISDRNLVVLSVFILGIIVGVTSFVRFLGWLLSRHHDPTVAALTGIVLGSLNKIWPWKLDVTVLEVKPGKFMTIEQINRLPDAVNGELFIALCLMAVGFSLAIWLNFSGKKSNLVLGK